MAGRRRVEHDYVVLPLVLDLEQLAIAVYSWEPAPPSRCGRRSDWRESPRSFADPGRAARSPRRRCAWSRASSRTAPSRSIPHPRSRAVDGLRPVAERIQAQRLGQPSGRIDRDQATRRPRAASPSATAADTVVLPTPPAPARSRRACPTALGPACYDGSSQQIGEPLDVGVLKLGLEPEWQRGARA